MHRVTRPDGLLALFEQNPFNPLTRHAVSTCELDRGVVLLRPYRARELMASSGLVGTDVRYFLFSPLDGSFGRSVDELLRWLPFGGQYLATARVPNSAPSPEPTLR
jgi:hypothetical protein